MLFCLPSISNSNNKLILRIGFNIDPWLGKVLGYSDHLVGLKKHRMGDPSSRITFGCRPIFRAIISRF